MTLLVSWIGKDSRKISSFYIATDSRISWGNLANYDYGQKVFSISVSPDIMGYCGDILYPSIVLNQIVNLANSSVLYGYKSDRFERSEKIYNKLVEKFEEYPSWSKEIMKDTIEILHVSRDNEIDFICYKYKWTRTAGWGKEELAVPQFSDKVIILGSGKKEYYKMYFEYYNKNNGKTSRALFQSFCHALSQMNNFECGGAPQLVSLYNKFNGNNLGVIFNNNRFLIGTESNNMMYSSVEWRNELFERCDGFTMQKLKGAQSQPNELRN